MAEGKPNRRKTGGQQPPRPKSPEEQRAHMEVNYLFSQEEQIAINDRRAYEDIRIRMDGSPSAIPPSPSLPLRFWAVIEYPPDGGEGDTVENRLADYEQWLKVLRRNGLYEGPTRLRFVNREEDSDAGGTDQGRGQGDAP